MKIREGQRRFLGDWHFVFLVLDEQQILNIMKYLNLKVFREVL
jgi:hypothetical protein